MTVSVLTKIKTSTMPEGFYCLFWRLLKLRFYLPFQTVSFGRPRWKAFSEILSHWLGEAFVPPRGILVSIAGDFSSNWAVIRNNFIWEDAKFTFRFGSLSAPLERRYPGGPFKGESCFTLSALISQQFGAREHFLFFTLETFIARAENANPAPRLIGEKRHPIPGPPNNCYLRITLSKWKCDTPGMPIT